jgi:dTMP kinase
MRAENDRTADRFEQERVEFFERARHGYLERARENPHRFRVADASSTPVEIQKRLEDMLLQWLQD